MARSGHGIISSLFFSLSFFVGRQQLRMSSVWTREQEEELAVLYEKYKEEDGEEC